MKFQPLPWLARKTGVSRYVILIGSLFAVIGLFFVAVFIGMQFNLFNVKGSSTTRNISLGMVPSTALTSSCQPIGKNIPTTCNWNKTQEWSVVHDAFIKDNAVLD